MNSSFSFRMPSTPTALFDSNSIGNSCSAAAIDCHNRRIHSGVAASTGGAAMRRSFGARMTFIRAMPVSAARVKSSSMPGSPMATQPMETFLPWMKMSPPRFVR